MKIKLQRTYRSKNGNAVFVYTVSGNSSDLEAFRNAQGEYYKEDDNGAPLWFTTRCVGQTGTLIITTNGNIVPDMSAFDQAASLAAQYGGNFGQTLAESLAKSIIGNAPSVDSKPSVKAENPAESDGLGEI
jgi:hypothetical protein